MEDSAQEAAQATAGVKPQLDICCLAFGVYFCGTLEQDPCCIDSLSHLRVCAGMKLQTKFRLVLSSLQPSRRHGTLTSSSPSQSSFSINSAGSHYSWHPPETQREKSHRDRLPPFLEAGTTVITTAESLRIFHRSAAQQGSQEGSEQAFIPSLMKQQLCTIKKGFPFV